MPDVNVPLLRKTLEHITDHPEEWNQRVWAKQTACGTVACLAGTAVTLAGHDISWDEAGYYGSSRLTDGQPIRAAAAEELGLSEIQQRELFDEDNSLSDLWLMAQQITDGEISASEQER